MDFLQSCIEQTKGPRYSWNLKKYKKMVFVQSRDSILYNNKKQNKASNTWKQQQKNLTTYLYSNRNPSISTHPANSFQFEKAPTNIQNNMCKYKSNM